MIGSHLIVQTNKFLLIDATAMTLGQGHGKVIQYILSDLYILCPKYLRCSSHGFDLRGKSHCGGGHGENELKHKVTPDRGDLITASGPALLTQNIITTTYVHLQWGSELLWLFLGPRWPNSVQYEFLTFPSWKSKHMTLDNETSTISREVHVVLVTIGSGNGSLRDSTQP